MKSDFNPIKAAYDLSALPYLSSDLRYSSTSYDRTGGNRDYNTRLYEDQNGECVILDVYGPGCVYKIFIPTSNDEFGWLKFYIDDAETPSIEGTFDEIFSGRHPVFDKSLVNIGVPKNSAFASYVPIPFAKHIKITSDCTPRFYYHIDYRIYSPETYIESWNPTFPQSEEMINLINQFSSCGKIKTSDNDVKSGDFSLLSAEKKDIFLISSETPLQITSFRIKLSGISNSPSDNKNFDYLKYINLKITFDDKHLPQIDAQLSGLFAFSDYGIDKNSSSDDGSEFYRTKSYITGIDENDYLYLLFPMPFIKSVFAEITNNSQKDFSDCKYELSIAPFNSEKAFGYLNIQRNLFEVEADDGNDITMLDRKGSGVFVGIASSMNSKSDIDHSYYLEGDEHIYIDGSKSPQINGTGTEDFYNGAYYWYDGTHSKPLYGCGYNSKWSCGRVHHNDDTTYKSMAYRFFVGDSIPFGSSFTFNIEHGFINDCYECGAATLFFYYNPNPILDVADIIKFGLEDDLKKHNYFDYDNRSGVSACRSRFEGLCTGKTISFNGIVMRRGGMCEFVLDTNSDSPIKLRRVFEYSFINQSAKVYIDGEYAGIWYDAGNNVSMRFRESEFVIPSSKVNNNCSVKIKLEITSETFSLISLSLICGCEHQFGTKSRKVISGKRYDEIFTDMQQFVSDSIRSCDRLSQEKLKIEFISSRYYISTSHLRRIVHTIAGISFTDYILSQKIEYAKTLLTTTELPIKSIALSLGIDDLSYFSRVFKRLTGETCTSYKSHKEEKAKPSN